ncbi:MAG: polysaccharide biosynthesis/export family protein [Candidatus Muirbacterium halophilum]|nr:polysaccharide biosynthesis/export family protein [Candidatus Muirbacterium halophilum]MCK9476605.1 polysaccharide biosynthesis/export family protein [Candidatus Muirbacterium halophilum]
MLKKIILVLILVSIVISHSFEYGDSIDIVVYNKFGLEEFADKFVVNKYGNIVLPFIGEIDVKNNDENSLKDVIYSKLHPDVFINPVISLNSNKNFFNISGMVNKEGRFNFSSQTLLSDAILMADNLKEGANTYNVKIIRDSAEIKVDYFSFQKGISSYNPVINDKDRIIIEELDFVYVLGEVEKPFKSYYSKDNDVIDLVLSASFTQRSALRYSRILRKDNESNSYAQIPMNLENVFKRAKINNIPVIQPGDVIFIPKNNGSKFDVFDLTINKISDIFSGLNNIKILRRNLF